MCCRHVLNIHVCLNLKNKKFSDLTQDNTYEDGCKMKFGWHNPAVSPAPLSNKYMYKNLHSLKVAPHWRFQAFALSFKLEKLYCQDYFTDSISYSDLCVILSVILPCCAFYLIYTCKEPKSIYIFFSVKLRYKRSSLPG